MKKSKKVDFVYTLHIEIDYISGMQPQLVIKKYNILALRFEYWSDQKDKCKQSRHFHLKKMIMEWHLAKTSYIKIMEARLVEFTKSTWKIIIIIIYIYI